jgi:hypothetical protein
MPFTSICAVLFIVFMGCALMGGLGIVTKPDISASDIWMLVGGVVGALSAVGAQVFLKPLP